MKRTVRRIRINVRHEAEERGLPFEDHVELAKFVALHAVRTFRIDLVPIHVAANSFNHFARAFEIAKPILGMCRPQLRKVFVDESLKDAFDMRFDRGAIGCAIILRVSDKGESGKSKEKKRRAERAKSHRCNLLLKSLT